MHRLGCHGPLARTRADLATRKSGEVCGPQRRGFALVRAVRAKTFRQNASPREATRRKLTPFLRCVYFAESRHESAAILAVGVSYSAPLLASCMDMNTQSLDSSAVLLNFRT